jgi:salicylate hydroxylase
MADGSQVGAGIHIPPNSGRLLHRWGVFEHLEKWAAQPESINIRRWEDGRMIGRTALDAMFQKDFKSPYYVVHRAHYYEALHQRALQLGVVLELGCRVVQYRENQGSVVLSDGSVIEGDLVVAADGMLSNIIIPIRDTADVLV